MQTVTAEFEYRGLPILASSPVDDGVLCDVKLAAFTRRGVKPITTARTINAIFEAACSALFKELHCEAI